LSATDFTLLSSKQTKTRFEKMTQRLEVKLKVATQPTTTTTPYFQVGFTLPEKLSAGWHRLSQCPSGEATKAASVRRRISVE
jgi:hypothetical protein